MLGRRRIPVFDPEQTDRIVDDVLPEQAERMVARRQASWIRGHRGLRLSVLGEPHLCRTHTSRGGMLAAIGRGQVYTYVKSAMSGTGRTQITSFKTIYSEDRSIFHMATISCIVPSGT